MLNRCISMVLVPLVVAVPLVACGGEDETLGATDEERAIRVTVDDRSCVLHTGGFGFAPGTPFPFWVTNEGSTDVTVHVHRLRTGSTASDPIPVDAEPAAAIEVPAGDQVQTTLDLQRDGEYYAECEGWEGDTRGGSFPVDDDFE